MKIPMYQSSQLTNLLRQAGYRHGDRPALLTRRSSSGLAGLLLLLITSSSPGANDSVLAIGDRRQVFIDGRFLASANNVKLVAHPPRKTGEHNLAADRPWERGGLGPYSCVIKEGEVYKMWYHAMDTKLWHTGPTNGAICYEIGRAHV